VENASESGTVWESPLAIDARWQTVESVTTTADGVGPAGRLAVARIDIPVMLSVLVIVVSMNSTKSASGDTQLINPALIGAPTTPPADESGVPTTPTTAIVHAEAKTRTRRNADYASQRNHELLSGVRQP
jgi:hypothetical protein